MAQLSLLFYPHLNVIKLTLVYCDFLSFYSTILEKYANEHSSSMARKHSIYWNVQKKFSL